MFDDKDIKVTFESYDDSGPEYPKLNLMVENNSDKPIEIATYADYINNVLAYSSMSSEKSNGFPESGQKGSATIEIYPDPLGLENRDQIQNIEFRLHIKNREPFELIAESAPIIIQLAIDVSKISKLDIPGEILVDRDDVKIVLREKIAHSAVEESGGFFQPVALFIENNSDHEVKVYIP